MPRPPLRLIRLANPVVRAVLDSQAHRLLSGRLVVVEYAGHRSGRPFRIPLRYAETADGRVVALAVRPQRKLWWRSFVNPARAHVMLRGGRIEVEGALAEAHARDEARETYVGRYPRSASVARDAAFVVFTPRSR